MIEIALSLAIIGCGARWHLGRGWPTGLNVQKKEQIEKKPSSIRIAIAWMECHPQMAREVRRFDELCSGISRTYWDVFMK